MTPIHAQMNLSLSTPGVADQVIQGFLHDQINLLAGRSVKCELVGCIRELELAIDIAGSEQLAGKTSNAIIQVAKLVLLRVNGPNNVSHRIHQLARGLCNLRDQLKDSRVVAALMRHLSEKRNLRKVGAAIVVQVSRNAGPNSLQFQHTCRAVAVPKPPRPAQQESATRQKPPTLPQGRQNGEGNNSRTRTGEAGGTDCSNLKAIPARAQAGKIDLTLLAQLAPTLA